MGSSDSDKGVAVYAKFHGQVRVLKQMSQGGQSIADVRQYQIHELAQLTGNDEREIQRSLYILEGHKYVAPFPAGDFTSKTWHITEGGLNALKDITEAPRIF